ncbi:MAG: hypothetical protein AAGD25_00095 [Cyanobacteria bacterium P01_F01_bin.150]
MIHPPNPLAPLPAIEPLEMLYVTNGSLLTAEGWWQAHHYYQHRQNLHYQSLHQPGIVSGLGVKVVSAPDGVPSELRDRRWIEIQPGIAIDLVGNPLVVDEPMTFRITSKVINQDTTLDSAPNGSLTVYVVLAYVDPTTKQWQTPPTAVVKEEFRINERTTPPDADEVELCRIHLTSNTQPLHSAADVFNPPPQSIDLRHRHRVQARANQLVQVGVLSSSIASASSSLCQRWSSLLQSLPGLYPTLAGSPIVQPITLTPNQQPNNPTNLSIPTFSQEGETTHQNLKSKIQNPPTPSPSQEGNRSISTPHRSTFPVQNPKSKIQNPPTVLVTSYEDAIALSPNELEQLQIYLAQGCTVVIENDDRDTLTHLNSLNTVQAELTSALADLSILPEDGDSELHQIRQDLEDELSECQTTVQQQLNIIVQGLQQWEQANETLAFTLAESYDSGLTQYPYLFDALPQLPTGPMYLLADKGIILVIGSLSAAWSRQQFDTPLSRSTMRDAQELGINILHYASSRQHMLQAQQ